MGKYPELSDLELLREVSEFNSLALEELYNRYSALLYTLIKKIAPDKKTAENILVEVFAIIWRKIEKFDLNAGNPYVWLVTLARNRAIDTVRRSRSSDEEPEFYDEAYENFFIVPTIAKNIDDMDIHTATRLRKHIENALEKLSDAQKYVIHLAYYEGHTLNDISVKLNIPVQTVRSKVMTAL